MTLLYVAVCLSIVGAIVLLQRFRHQDAKACVWWAYSVLLFGIGWEIIDAVFYGAPAFPSTRWVTYPGLAIALWAAALVDLIALGLRTPFAKR